MLVVALALVMIFGSVAHAGKVLRFPGGPQKLRLVSITSASPCEILMGESWIYEQIYHLALQVGFDPEVARIAQLKIKKIKNVYILQKLMEAMSPNLDLNFIEDPSLRDEVMEYIENDFERIYWPQPGLNVQLDAHQTEFLKERILTVIESQKKLSKYLAGLRLREDEGSINHLNFYENYQRAMWRISEAKHVHFQEDRKLNLLYSPCKYCKKKTKRSLQRLTLYIQDLARFKNKLNTPIYHSLVDLAFLLRVLWENSDALVKAGHVAQGSNVGNHTWPTDVLLRRIVDLTISNPPDVARIFPIVKRYADLNFDLFRRSHQYLVYNQSRETFFLNGMFVVERRALRILKELVKFE